MFATYHNVSIENCHGSLLFVLVDGHSFWDKDCCRSLLHSAFQHPWIPDFYEFTDSSIIGHTHYNAFLYGACRSPMEHTRRVVSEKKEQDLKEISFYKVKIWNRK